MQDINSNIDIKRIKRALLIQVPGSADGPIKFIPYGLLSVGKIFKRYGFEVKIKDLCMDDINQCLEEIKSFKPCLIGLGGISTSFSPAEKISRLLHSYFPDAIYIAGGPLSSTFDLLIEGGVVDYVFHGETENSLPKFIEFIESRKGLDKIGGISFLRQRFKPLGIKNPPDIEWDKWSNECIYRSLPEEPMPNLDDCGHYDYKMIDLNRYILNLSEWYKFYKAGIKKIPALESKIKKLMNEGRIRYLEVFASRGCTHSCKFCYRHTKGIRYYSISHVIDNIRMLKETYNVDGISFIDELFNAESKRIFALCDALEGSNLNLSYFFTGGMRTDKINAEMLKRLAEVGFISINFGHESGSDTVLRYFGKGVTRQQNVDSILLTKKYNIFTVPQLVIGSPIETMKTIRETNKFLAETDVGFVSINYIIPLPEAPIWEEIKDKGYIKDVKKYLERVRIYQGSYLLRLNISQINIFTWVFWYILLERTVFINRHRKNIIKRLYYQTYLYKIIAIIKKLIKLI